MFKLMVGREYDLNPGFHLGETGPIWFLPVDLTGDAATRNAILGGADPITACGLTIDDVYAYYAMDNDGGADSSPNAYNLTAQGAPSPRNYLFALRDQSANGVNLRATTGAPTWDATAFSNRGGAVFNGTSQFLVRDAAPIAAAPIQAYGVAESSSLAADQGVFWLGDKDAGNQWWTLMFNGVNPGDPVAWYVETGAGVAAFSSTGYSANTPHLLWGIEAASNNREVELDGAGNGTNGTNLTPVGVDRVGLGAYLDSSPSNYLSGQIGAVLLLDTASIAEQSDMFAWVEDQFGIVLP